MIIQWPKSQICMDCVSARWLSELTDESIVHPASECIQNLSFDGVECPRRIDISDAVRVELFPFDGFLWVCPVCKKSNDELKKILKVTCTTCERIFSVKSNN